MLIDTHCHLHDKEFFSAEQAEECLKRAHEAGVEKVICIGTSHEDSLEASEFASKHKNVYWTYGIHPENVGREVQRLQFWVFRSAVARGLAPSARGRLLEETSEERAGSFLRDDDEQTTLVDGPDGRDPEWSVGTSPVAIGEVGLDYHYTGYDREAQIRLFEEMLQLAVDNDLPVSFHVREAFPDFFAVVANFPRVRGVVHSFTDSKKVLKRVLNETEFYVGVNGLATYSTLPMPPIERILLETDAPFLAPVPHRGEGNEPAYIANIADWLTEKLEISRKEVADITTNNAIRLFKLA